MGLCWLVENIASMIGKTLNVYVPIYSIVVASLFFLCVSEQSYGCLPCLNHYMSNVSVKCIDRSSCVYQTCDIIDSADPERRVVWSDFHECTYSRPNFDMSTHSTPTLAKTNGRHDRALKLTRRRFLHVLTQVDMPCLRLHCIRITPTLTLTSEIHTMLTFDVQNRQSRMLRRLH
jgi:hypothetical protein